MLTGMFGAVLWVAVVTGITIKSTGIPKSSGTPSSLSVTVWHSH